MGMRNCKDIRNPEKMKEWGIKGIYNEYGLQRTCCSCGHVEAGRMYVCPDCGNAEFVTITDWSGTVTGRTDKKIFADAAKKSLSINTTWLKLVRDSTDSAYLNLEEEVRSEEFFCEKSGSSWRVTGMSHEEVQQAIYDNRNIFSNGLRECINLSEMMKLDYDEFCNFRGLLSNGALDIIRTVYTNGEYNFARALASSHFSYNFSWPNAEAAMIELGIPRFLENERDNPDIIKAFSNYNCRNLSSKSIAEKNWRYLPVDIKMIILHYLKQGLIDGKQFLDMNFFSERLFKSYPDIQMKMIRKYFANFSNGTSLDNMYDYYVENGLPITIDTFDFRAWRAHVNSSKLKELKYSESMIDCFTDSMDVDPVGSIIKLNTMRRPRQPKDV